jgi:hypothetical protein
MGEGKKMAYYVYSTLANDQKYVTYKPLQEGQDIGVIDESVLIEGKANVATKNLVTPRGLVTKVSEAQYKILEKCPAFKKHVENGYISVTKKEAKLDKVLGGMVVVERDVSAPTTPDWYKKGNGAALPKELRSA